MATTIEEIEALVKRLPPDDQKQVLQFAQGLARSHQTLSSLPKTPLPPGTSGAALLTTLRSLKFSSEDIDAMERALEGSMRQSLYLDCWTYS